MRLSPFASGIINAIQTTLLPAIHDAPAEGADQKPWCRAFQARLAVAQRLEQPAPRDGEADEPTRVAEPKSRRHPCAAPAGSARRFCRLHADAGAPDRGAGVSCHGGSRSSNRVSTVRITSSSACAGRRVLSYLKELARDLRATSRSPYRCGARARFRSTAHPFRQFISSEAGM